MSTLMEISRNEEIQTTQYTSQVKKINNLLNRADTRVSGLTLLQSYLPNCSDEDFIENCVSWMQSCCKIDVKVKNNSFTINILDGLLKASASYSELKKSVSFFITTRFFDYFLKYFADSPDGWLCAETCFSLYRGACGPFQEKILTNLKKHLHSNSKISVSIAKCFALFPSLGGGGHEAVIYKNNWKTEFCRCIQVCHSILNDLFVDFEEFEEFVTDGNTYEKNSEKVTADYLTVQFYNHCLILNHMLLNQYPAPKCIPTDLLLQMICRGLAVNPNRLGDKQTTSIIALRNVLPEVHAILLSLLTALIVTCRNQLLPYAHVVCKLIRQTLEWTESDYIYGSTKPYASLRVSAYDSLCNWLIATRSSSCVEIVSKVVISSAIADIQSKKRVTLLKETKHSKKRATSEEQASKRRVDSSANSELCYAALKALQLLIKYVGGLLKTEEHKFLQEVTIKLLNNIQNSSCGTMLVPYSMTQCRLGLYSLLLELTQQPCANWPPPTHFALRIFSRGQNDNCPEISQFCSTGINGLTNILHSSFVSPEEEETAEEGNKVQWREKPLEEETKTRSTMDEDETEAPEIHEVPQNVQEAEKEIETVAELIAIEEIHPSLEPMEKNTTEVKEVEEIYRNTEHVDEDSEGEKISNPSHESEILLNEDSTSTEVFKKIVEDKCQEKEDEQNKIVEIVEVEEIVEPPSKKSKQAEAEKTPTKEVDREEPKTPELKSPSTTPETPNKKASDSPEDLSNGKSPAEDSRTRDPRKRYFLRSKASKSSSEDSEDGNKSLGSADRGFRTPTPTVMLTRATITSGSNRKSKTKKSAKLKTALEEKGKGEEDEDEDIIQAFHVSFVE